MCKRSWVEIDKAQLVTNFRAYAAALPAGLNLWAVVKANAYGHGDVAVARLLQESCDARLFAVATVDEAIRLREGGISGEILILGYTPPEAFARLAEYDISQTLLSEDYAALFYERAPKGVRCHAALDTGMNRIGFPTHDAQRTAQVIRSYADTLRLEGIFTHLCVADSKSDDDIAFTKGQVARFTAVAEALSDLRLPHVHCLNSAGGITAPAFGNGARLGIILYGLYPSADVPLPTGIRPALTWKSVISAIHTARPGEFVGYGRTHAVTRDTRVATIPTGYADGYSRLLSGRGKVRVRGGWAPVIGRVCMDQMMIDVTDVPDAALYDEVTLIGEGYTADDMARDISTIGYEIVCDISARVPRIYK